MHIPNHDFQAKQSPDVIRVANKKKNVKGVTLAGDVNA